MEVDVWTSVWDIGFWEEGVERVMCGGGGCGGVVWRGGCGEEGVERMMCGGGVCGGVVWGGTYCRYVEVWCGRLGEDCVLYLHKAL